MTAEELLRKYQNVYGEIVFPDDDINVLREIWRNPAGWMYSFDGIQWEAAPISPRSTTPMLCSGKTRFRKGNGGIPSEQVWNDKEENHPSDRR